MNLNVSENKEGKDLFSLSKGKMRNKLGLFLLLVFIFSILPLSAFGDTRVEIFGYVRDDDTGNPIYNAKVDLFYENNSIPFISTYTDSNGRIDTTVYATNTIKRVEISRTGYIKKSTTISSYSSSINLGTNYLEPGTSSNTGNYRVYGTIVDEDDDSYITDARVMLVDDYEGITYVGYSNSRGKFDVINLPLGDYEVTITKYGYKNYERTNLLRLRTGDYDMGTIELDSTTGSSSNTSDKKLTGRITDENGYYVQNAEVYLINENEEEIKVKTDSRGYYTFDDIETGTYTIGVNATGYELLERINYARILSSDREKEINLVIRTESRTGYEVYGRVLDEDREYIEGVEVYLLDGNTRIKKTTSDSRGYYEFKYVQNGRYSIEFKKLGYKTEKLVDEVRINGSYYSVSQVEMEITQGSSSVVGGLVGDSQSGLNGITVYLQNSLDSYTATTNYYGYFTFNDVREGKYDLYARINNEKKLLETDLRITGSRTEVGDINVNRVGTGYKLTGTVEDNSGYELSNVTVKAVSSGVTKETTTNSNGDYTITGLERGTYTITVTKNGFGTKTDTISITSYDLEKDFTLKENDYVKVVASEITLGVDERIDLLKYITKAEIYSAKHVLLDNISSSFEVYVPDEYSSYLTTYSDKQIRGNKTGTAYINISISNSRDYDNLSAATLKVTITEPKVSREAVLTIGSNYYILDGKTETSDATPYIKSDRSFFPIRVIAKALGVTDGNIKWDSITNTATLTKGSDTVEFIVGKEYYKQNGVTLYMDVQAENVNGRVYLPARYVSDALGGEIEWNNFTKSLTIKTK